NKAHFESEKEAIHLILTGIGDEIYSTIDACQTAQEMWEATERLQQESELRAERLARNANPLALVATAQANQDPYYQTSKSHKSYAPSSKPSIPTRSHTTTRYKGKEITKSITPPSESASKDNNNPKKAQRDKDMQKNLALIAKKPKRVKESAYHKEKMLLCKQVEKGVPLQAAQYDWLADTNEEIDEHELEAHYSYMETIQEVPTANSGTNSETLKKNDQNDVESDDEHVALATWHGNRTKSHYEGLVKQKINVIMDLKLKEEHDMDKMLSLEKQLKFLNEIVYKRNQSIQTIHMMAPKVPTYNGRPTFANPRYLNQAQSKIPCLYAFPYDQSTHANRLIPVGEKTLALK
nr:hypothetical protein [Tanacetum cinerariifolium]